MGLCEKSYLLLLTALLVSSTARAQDLSKAPASHSFWDITNKTLFASHATLEAVDFGITHRNLSHGGKELDPAAKVLCESGTPGQLIFFGGRMAGVVAV